jgi:hypothetical protein
VALELSLSLLRGIVDALLMTKYVRTSICLQHIRWPSNWIIADRGLRHREDMLICFLPAFYKCTSLKKLHMVLPPQGGQSSQAFENMVAHAQSLQSLSNIYPNGILEEWAVGAASENTILREFTLKAMSA